MLKIYNTLTRKKEVFKPIKKKEVGIYTCGPTVYDYAHIGNFRSYIFEDILRRYLEYLNYKVKHVMNITDVDDKTIKNSITNNTTLDNYTKKFKTSFLEDLETLNIEKAHILPEATKHIKEIVKTTNLLLKKGFAYKGKDNCIYYSVSKFKNYGKLAKLDMKGLKVGARVTHDEYEKESLSDFALWKAWTPRDKDVFWETELGKGRPGWHIECSVMSTKYLGETFDIHCGGVDLIFPHHTNEIAQSESATGKKFVNYWMHCEHLLVENKKMSKSLGNFYTLRDLIKKGYSGKEIRYLLLSSHYKQQLNFTFKALDAAKNTLQRLQDFIDKLKTIEGKDSDTKTTISKVKKDFESAMDDDLNTPNALSKIFNFIREINTLISQNKIGKENKKDILNLMKKFNKVLGVIDFEEKTIPEEIKQLIEKRESARKDKDWETADKLRNQLKEKGILLEDTKQGVQWKQIS